VSIDEVTASCTVEFDPTPPAKTWTTHDEATLRHTIEAVPKLVGDLQVYAGREYIYTGTKWIPLDDDDNDDNEA
jgi:hypothetical protein